MNSTSQNSAIDETLRMLAQAPVPEGLEDRVHEALKTAPKRSRMLAWPVSGSMVVWTRAAAAAAIALVVVGGGWGVYRHVNRPGTARIVVAPAVQPAAGGGFSSAGAMRTPQTVKGAVVGQPEKQQVSTSASQQAGKPAKKPVAKPLPANQ